MYHTLLTVFFKSNAVCYFITHWRNEFFTLLVTLLSHYLIILFELYRLVVHTPTQMCTLMKTIFLSLLTYEHKPDNNKAKMKTSLKRFQSDSALEICTGSQLSVSELYVQMRQKFKEPKLCQHDNMFVSVPDAVWFTTMLASC